MERTVLVKWGTESDGGGADGRSSEGGQSGVLNISPRTASSSTSSSLESSVDKRIGLELGWSTSTATASAVLLVGSLSCSPSLATISAMAIFFSLVVKYLLTAVDMIDLYNDKYSVNLGEMSFKHNNNLYDGTINCSA